MMSLNCLARILFVLTVVVLSTVLHARVLELGESELRGKKDQPESMTLISRAPLSVDAASRDWQPLKKIEQEIERDIFNVSTRE